MIAFFACSAPSLWTFSLIFYQFLLLFVHVACTWCSLDPASLCDSVYVVYFPLIVAILSRSLSLLSTHFLFSAAPFSTLHPPYNFPWVFSLYALFPRLFFSLIIPFFILLSHYFSSFFFCPFPHFTSIFLSNHPFHRFMIVISFGFLCTSISILSSMIASYFDLVTLHSSAFSSPIFINRR